MNKITPGLYKHFKGKMYEVIGIAQHSESLEEYVVYKHLDDGSLWIRPSSMFSETITRDGKTFPRFVKVESK